LTQADYAKAIHDAGFIGNVVAGTDPVSLPLPAASAVRNRDLESMIEWEAP